MTGFFLSQYFTNLMHKICYTISFISYLYMFRAHVLIIRRSKLHYTASGIITPIGGRLVYFVYMTVWYAGAYAPAYQTVLYTVYSCTIKLKYILLGDY